MMTCTVTCRDIDECAVQNGNCSQICVNTNGSYYCACYAGYQLNADNRTCDDINECATANGDCSQICVNTNGSYYCMCEPGYWLEPNLKNCSDINECADMNGNCSQVCTNTRGSFFCSCNCSYQLGEDDRTCYFQCPTNLPPNLILEGTARVNTVAGFSCPQGYGLVGSGSLQCNGDGTWSGAFPQCIEEVCPFDVGGTSHLEIRGLADYGSTNTFFCDFGYMLTGAAVQTCQPDGSWSEESLPTCAIAICDTLVLPSNGRTTFDYWDDFDSGTLVPGDAAYFACDQGYQLVGSSTTVCLANGTWSAPAPTCAVANCPSSMDIHLRMEGPGAVNTSVTFSCDLGYRLTGSPSLSCNPDVTWNDTLPICTQVLCPEVTLPSVGTSGANTPGSSVLFSCDQGYMLTGPSNIVCQADGAWSGPAPSCVVANCSSSSGDIHLRMEGSGAVNTSVTFSCDFGYRLTGSPSLSCNPDVTWSGSLPSCTQVLCPEVTPPSGGSVVGTSGANTPGSSVVFSCDQGYMLTGPSTIVCQADESWSGPTPSCVVANCSSSSGDIHLRMEGSGAVNTSVTFNCDLGYRLDGSPSLSCNPDVTWNDTLPSCSQVLCPKVTPPSGGSVVGTSGANTPGSSVVFSCDQGYMLTGPSTIVCQADGAWSGPTPSCVVANCSASTDAHLRMNSSGQAGTFVGFSCDLGYILNGSLTLICDLDVTWSGPLPSCTEVQCPDVTPPAMGAIVNGNTFASNGRPGDAIVFSCDEGYSLKGPGTIVCQSDGAWSFPVPSCDIVNCSSDSAGPNLQTMPIGHTSHGTNVSFSCALGYTLNGSSFLTCEPTGQWSGALPSCDQILCPSITPPQNGQLLLPGTTIGSTATFSCNQGYTLVGSNRSTCQNNGKWDTPPPTCQIAQCPPLSDPHLHMNGTGAVGTNVTVWCDPIYSLSGGPDTIRCTSDGTWSPMPPTCVINVCLNINVSALNDTFINNTKVDTTFGAIPGSSVTFGCANGAQVVVETIYCLSQGTWSAKPPFCSKAPQPQPEISASGGANIGLIAGASVGAIVGVAIVIAVIAVIVWNRKRRGSSDIGLSIKAEDTSHLLDEEDDGSTNL